MPQELQGESKGSLSSYLYDDQEPESQAIECIQTNYYIKDINSSHQINVKSTNFKKKQSMKIRSLMFKKPLLQQIQIIGGEMEKDYSLSRLDKAKEALIASRREDTSQRESEHKKKKKHKDNRPSRSGSRHSRDKKKRSRSRDHSQSKKHKKHHRSRDSPERRRHHDHSRDDNQKHRDHPKDRQHPRDYDRERGGQDRERQHKHRKREEKPAEEKDPYYERRRQIQRVRRTNPAKAEELEAELQKQIIFDQKEKQLEEAKEKFREAQKEMEEAKREDLTILVYCLPLKAKEKDIWNFFSKTNCGKIRDIRIIRDARSGRSKGVAYVEFYTSEAVQRALTMADRPFELKGREFMGLRVQHSQAEKNRAAAAAKQMRVIKPADPIEQQQEQIRRQTKVFVSGLVDKLADITEKELKELFDPFGQIQYVDIHRDPQTGQCKGYAFIQYVDTEKAKMAVKDMNGLTVGSQKIGVQLMTVQQRGEISAGEDYLYSKGSKDALRQTLAGSTGPSYSNLQRPPISTVTTPYLIMTNMFKMEGTTPAFFEDMKREVQKQTEEYGVVERIFIEKNNQGNIWIKYSDTASALKAQESLNGKFFDGHKIFIYFVTENTYQTRVGI